MRSGRPWPSFTRGRPPSGPYSPDPESAGKRALRNAALDLLVATGEASEIARAERHYREASNMTDAITALSILSHRDAPARDDGARRFLCALAGGAARARQMVRRPGPRREAQFGRDRAQAPLPPEILAEEPEPHPRAARQLRPRQSHRLQPRRRRGLSSSSPSRRSRSTASTRMWRRGCSAPSRAGAFLSRKDRLAPRRCSRISPAKSAVHRQLRDRHKDPGRRLESLAVNGLLTEFPQVSSGQTTPSSIPMAMRAIRRCGNFSGSKQENVRGTEWRGCVRRVTDSRWRGRTGRISVRSSAAICPNAELLRRLVPLLLIGFVLVALTGFTFQLIHSKRRGTRCCERISLR